MSVPSHPAMNCGYTSLTGTWNGVDSEEVTDRVQAAQQPHFHTPPVDQARIYTAIAGATEAASAARAAPPSLPFDVTAVQAAAKAQSGVNQLKGSVAELQAEQFSQTGLAIYDSAGSGGGLVVDAGGATLQSYADGVPTAKVALSATGVTISPALDLPGLEEDVATELNGIKDEIEAMKVQAAVELAAGAAVDAAQTAGIASLLAKVFPPAGYAPLDPELDPDPDNDGSEPNTQSLEPLTLAPKGEFATSSRCEGSVCTV